MHVRFPAGCVSIGNVLFGVTVVSQRLSMLLYKCSRFLSPATDKSSIIIIRCDRNRAVRERKEREVLLRCPVILSHDCPTLAFVTLVFSLSLSLFPSPLTQRGNFVPNICLTLHIQHKIYPTKHVRPPLVEALKHQMQVYHQSVTIRRYALLSTRKHLP